MKTAINTNIKNLSKDIFERKKHKQNPHILLLGAGASISSGCPSWWQLCKEYCENRKIAVTDNKYIEALQKKLSEQHKTDIYNFFAKKLKGKEPSIGYLHLASLIEKGFFNTIITTNYDNLLEKSLAKIMPIDNIKALIRGEVSDDRIIDFLEEDIPDKIQIIKLHGDLQSNIFLYNPSDTFTLKKELTDCLRSKIKKNGSIIVGYAMEDSDLIGLYNSNAAVNYYVNPKEPESNVKQIVNLINKSDNIFTQFEKIKNEDPEVTHIPQKVNSVPQKYEKIEKTLTEIKYPKEQIEKCSISFDDFFTELNINCQRDFISSEVDKRKQITESILAKQEKGNCYINYSNLGKMVKDFWAEIKDKYDKLPNVIVFINDPTAPGGMEVKRRMIEHIKEHPDIKIETVKIEGDQTRYNKRKVTSNNPIYDTKVQSILILDSISFSGNTLKIAIEKYKEWFPKYSIRGGIMVIDDQLSKKLQDDTILKDTIFSKTTDRHEIFFPWGITQATKECKRELESLDSLYPITISTRPWGTVEVLAQQTNCSVRILTIEADQKLSFQRHLVRDELFVSLDENIGLEICSETLDNLKNPDINDITEIKSLVLEKGDYVLIPKGIWHRTKASKDRVRLLEIGFGTYDQEKDIERIDDKFGRINLDGAH